MITNKLAFSQIIVLTFLLFGCGGHSDDHIQYVALGASDAVGIGATPLSNGYVFLIEDALDQSCSATDLTNLGIPGIELEEVRDIQLPLAEEVEPEIVTWWPGANDLIDGKGLTEYASQLEEILGELSEETDATLYIATLPDISMAPRFVEEPDPDVTPQRVSQFNEITRQVTLQFGGVVVELSGEPITQDLVRDEDGFHPNDDGYAVIADRFLEQILARPCP